MIRQVQFESGIASVAVLTPHVKAGRLRAIAVTGDKRSHAMPEAQQKFLVREIERWGKVVREHSIRAD